MNIHKHKSQPYNNTNNNQLTPELNHHLISSRRSGPLGLVLPTKNKRWNSSSQTETNSQTNSQTTPAFNIIEVVLVLAFAGLMFLMVFITLPALQRNQRDTQRKNDMARVLSAVKSFQANNNGIAPQAGDYGQNLVPNYLKANGDEFKDPDGSEYVFAAGSNGYDTPLKGTRKSEYGSSIIYIYYQYECDDGKVKVSSGKNKIAYSIALESGGVYCVNN